MPQFGIDPGDAGNRRGIVLFRLKHPRMMCQPIIKHIIRLAAKNCTQIPQIPYPSNYEYMYVHDTTISHVFCMPEYSPGIFFLEELLPFFFVFLVFECYH